MKKTHLLRILALVLVLVLCVPVPGSALKRRDLKVGDTGDDVIILKNRLNYLGYYSTPDLTDEYTEDTAKKVKSFQKKNGQKKKDGVATVDLQKLLFSNKAIAKNGLTAAEIDQQKIDETFDDEAAETGEDTKNAGMPKPAGPDAPKLTKEGYLKSGKPYVYANRETGEWSYVSKSIHVEIRQYSDPSIPQIWLVAKLRYREPAFFGAMVNQKTTKNEQNNTRRTTTFLTKPLEIAEKSGAIFAFSDDFFGTRIEQRLTVGIVVRNGRVWSDRTRASKKTAWPTLDVMALYADGRLKTYLAAAHTADDYLKMGVVSTFAFGPILVKKGVLQEDVPAFRSTGITQEPRMAMGQMADGTVVVLNALGRRRDSSGVSLSWMAEKMYDLGCVEALNLDGGNTTCMIFNGDMINRVEGISTQSIRDVNSLIGVREGAD